MPDAKRPDPRRRGPAPRPGRAGAAGRPRSASARRETRAIESREGKQAREAADGGTDSGPDTVAAAIRRSVTDASEQHADQRFGSAARRAAILAAVVCVLTLTIAGPVRTYFAQRTEMNQLKQVEAQLRSQIADLEQQKIKLEDPVFIAAQARERLGFVMPGDIPYQVQLPPGAATAPEAAQEAPTAVSTDPWYTSLWHTIADAPHGVSSVITPTPAPDAPPPPAPPTGPAGG